MTERSVAIEALENAGNRMEPRIARAFRQALEELRSQLNEAELEDLIERRQIDTIIGRLGLEVTDDAFQVTQAAISQAILEGGAAAAAAQPAVIGRSGQKVNFVFNATNPRLQTVAREVTGFRISQVSNDIRQVTRQVITDGLVRGNNPRTIARDVKQSIGLTQKQEAAVRSYREGLVNRDRRVLDRKLRDKRYDRSVARAIRNGKGLTEQQIDKATEAYRRKAIQHRSQVIARTESTRAVQAGSHALTDEYIESGRIDPRQVRRFWVHTQDEVTRNEHRAIAGMNPEGVGQNERFETPLGPLLYPGDPNGTAANTIFCRCTVFTRIVSMELIDG